MESKLKSLASNLKQVDTGLDAEALRSRFLSEGHKINSLKLPAEVKPFSLACCDSSVARRELRHHILWGAHAVCVRGTFDGAANPDGLTGRGTTPYAGLEYESAAEFGQLEPADDLDGRLAAARIALEYEMLAQCAGGSDYLLVDGSLVESRARLEGEYPEYERARRAWSKLSRLKVVGLVEDSRGRSVSKKLGLNTTDTQLFDLILRPLEYASFDDEGCGIFYLKLAAKKLLHTPGTASPPLTVRWEFALPESADALALFAAAWQAEDDVLHPQHYPMRAADYLTRKLKVGGVLADFAGSEGLEDAFRNQRRL